MATPAPIVGIDLGTTYSVIAYLDANGTPTTVRSAEGDLTTPSVVLFDDTDVVVGKIAQKAATMQPQQVAQLVKREMGNATFSKSINGEHFPPEVIQALILEKLKQDAESQIGPFDEAVITVPAYFNEPKRKATQDAGQMAGIRVLDIINEPTAAAISCGVQAGFLRQAGESDEPMTILVYDLGGGTFDVSLLRIHGQDYTVLATDGNVQLGGADWDRRLVDFLAEEFKLKHGVDPRDDESGRQRMWREAEDAKRSLTARETVAIALEHRGEGLMVKLTREKFEELTAPLLDRTRFTITNLLQQAKSPWQDVDRVLLAGGSTRMPQVSRMLERESGKSVERSLSPDEAVAHGAAIYAGILRARQEQKPTEMKVTNVNSHSLSVLAIEKRTGRPRARTIIEANTALPAMRSAKFRTQKEGQQSVVVNVIEGGDASGNNSTAIGKCVVHDLPEGLAAGTPVDVTFSYAANGRLTVHARLPDIDREAQMEIQRASGLDQADVDQWTKRLRDGITS